MKNKTASSFKSIKFSALPNSIYIFLIVFLVFSFTVKNFLSPTNISNLILQATVLVIISLGMSLVIMMGCIDLSVGSVISISSVSTAYILHAGVHWLPAILGGLAVGTLFGVLNGVIIQKIKIDSFIVTFGTMGIAQSLANTLADNRTVYWEASAKNGFIKTLSYNIFSIKLGSGPASVLSLSFIALLGIIVVGVLLFLFKKTKLGSYVYAIGANEEVARLAGINTARWKIGIYALSGLLAAIAGSVLLIRTQCVQPTLGEGLEFQAVVAAILGGNSLKGGKGSLTGTILGAFVLYSIRSALALAGISTYAVMVVIGSVLIIGMIINELVAHYEEKARLAAAKVDGVGGTN